MSLPQMLHLYDSGCDGWEGVTWSGLGQEDLTMEKAECVCGSKSTCSKSISFTAIYTPPSPPMPPPPDLLLLPSYIPASTISTVSVKATTHPRTGSCPSASSGALG